MMLNSQVLSYGNVIIPKFDYRLSMQPFDLNTLIGVPTDLLKTVEKMIKNLPLKIGTAFLTADCKSIKKGNTHRRGGAHIDGNYLYLGWNTTPPNPGWKVEASGTTLTKEQHKESYCSLTGGMLITSDYKACKGWVGLFDDDAGVGGSCEHMQLEDGFWLEPNKIYYGSSQFIHQSMPVNEDVTRRLIRITLPKDYPYIFK